MERESFLRHLRNLLGAHSHPSLLDHLRGRSAGNDSLRVSGMARHKALNLRCVEDWENFKARIFNLESVENAARAHKNGDAVLRAIGLIKRDAAEIKTPAEFDGETSENLAAKIIKMAERLMPILELCGHTSTEAPSRRLEQAIDAYFAALGISKINFNEGDSIEEWIKLYMERDMVAQPTDDPQKAQTICRVYVQPRVMHYANADGEIEMRYFGGKCAVYAAR